MLCLCKRSLINCKIQQNEFWIEFVYHMTWIRMNKQMPIQWMKIRCIYQSIAYDIYRSLYFSLSLLPPLSSILFGVHVKSIEAN